MCVESKLNFSDYVFISLEHTHIHPHSLSPARELICHIHLPPVMHIVQLESKSVLAKHLSAGTHDGNEIRIAKQQKSNQNPTMRP